MKKITKGIYNKYFRKTLYLEDLTEIENELKSYFKDYYLEDDDYQYNSIGELIKNNKKKYLNKIKFSGDDHLIKEEGKTIANVCDLLIEIDKESILIFSSTSKLEIKGIVAKLESLINIKPIKSTVAYYIHIGLGIFFSSKIYLVDKSEKDSFIKRNKDKIIFLIIGAILTFVVQLLIKVLT